MQKLKDDVESQYIPLQSCQETGEYSAQCSCPQKVTFDSYCSSSCQDMLLCDLISFSYMMENQSNQF